MNELVGVVRSIEETLMILLLFKCWLPNSWLLINKLLESLYSMKSRVRNGI